MYICTYVRTYVCLYVCMYICRYESKASYFLSENIMTIIMNSVYSMGAAITNLRLFSHKIFFHMNTLFPRLPQTLYVSRVKLFAEASEFLPLAVFQFLVDGNKTASYKSILQGTKKWKSYGTVSGMLGG
jgi:hypothetical protein